MMRMDVDERFRMASVGSLPTIQVHLGFVKILPCRFQSDSGVGKQRLFLSLIPQDLPESSSSHSSPEAWKP
jgi:hypothetical protein